jgi:hypothetical protein
VNGPVDASTFPAPGSAAPGAPPPLKRALTPADGVPDAAPAAPVAAPAAVRPISQTRAPGGGPRLVVAAAMLGVATGLEIAGALSHRRRKR